MIAVGDHVIVQCNPLGQRLVAANWQRDLNSATTYSESGYRFWLQIWNEFSWTVEPAHPDLIGRKFLAPQHKGLTANPGDKPLANSRGNKTPIELFHLPLATIRDEVAALIRDATNY